MVRYIPLLLLPISLLTFATSCVSKKKAPLPIDDYTDFSKRVGEFPVAGVFNASAGTVATWVYFVEGVPRQDQLIFSSNDSRYVLSYDTYSSKGKEVCRILARAGGNQRAAQAPVTSPNFPEASLIIDDGSYADWESNTGWLGLRAFPEGEWHHVAMVWSDLDGGEVRLFLDGQPVAKRPYNPLADDGQPPATQVAVAIRPSDWNGSMIPGGNGMGVPSSAMSLSAGGIAVSDFRLYRRALTGAEVLAVIHAAGRAG